MAQHTVLYLLIPQGQRAHEVAEIVGQSVKLKPDLVVAELPAGEARPFDRVLACLDPLHRRATLIAERHHHVCS